MEGDAFSYLYSQSLQKSLPFVKSNVHSHGCSSSDHSCCCGFLYWVNKKARVPGGAVSYVCAQCKQLHKKGVKSPFNYVSIKNGQLTASSDPNRGHHPDCKPLSVNEVFRRQVRTFCRSIPFYSKRAIKSAMFQLGQLDQNEIKTRIKQLFSAYLSNRKLVVGTVGFFVFILYLWPHWFGLGKKSVIPDASYYCLENQLRQFSKSEVSYDSLIIHHPDRREWEKPWLPFVGNGHMGLAVGDSKEQLRISNGRSLKSLIGLQPVIHASVRDGDSVDAYVVEYLSGTVRKLQCYLIAQDCVVITSTIYTHRKYPSVLVQEVTVRNPIDKTVEVDFTRATVGWDQKSSKNIGSSRNSVEVLSRSLTADDNRVVAVSALLPSIPNMVAVKAHGSESYRFLSVIDYSEPTQSDLYSNQKKAIEERVLKRYEQVVGINAGVLDKEHGDVWSELWRSGFGISYSRAPDTLNPDHINATRYAVLSNTPAPLHQTDVSEEEKKKLNAAMSQNELCYSSHNTLLFPSKLWSPLATAEQIVDVAILWRLTLEKRGCMHMLAAGADGIAQAMLLSFGGLKYSHHHLEFGTHPNDLHREYEYHNIKFGEHLLNIWVQIGADNKAILYVSLISKENEGKQNFYACDAGCLDAPVHLSSERTQFPVKLTSPVTPILYIAADRSHIEDLKHTIHVKEVGEAPAHEYHVLALHRHGHRLGGLPTLFWVALAFLIITFHLFLCKLVYTEWVRTNEKPYSRGRYSM